MSDAPADRPPAIIEIRADAIRKRARRREVEAALRELLEDTDLLSVELDEMKASVAGTKGEDERRRRRLLTP